VAVCARVVSVVYLNNVECMKTAASEMSTNGQRCTGDAQADTGSEQNDQMCR